MAVILALGLLSRRSAMAQNYLDTIVFGDTVSEAAHSFSGPNTQIITGGLSQSARQCLANPSSIHGGDITVTMAVDPVKRNYVTVKLWGKDDTDEDNGRLYLYVPLNSINYQVGYRHEGDCICLSVAANHPPLPGRFLYSTTLLPLWMTQGKTNLTLKIVSAGRIYALGSGGPPSGNSQYATTENSRGIYRAYTHTDAVLPPSGETQGGVPFAMTRTFPTESVLNPGGVFYNGVNNYINGRLTAAVSTSTFSTTDVEMLARAHWMTNLSAYQSPSVINRVAAVMDVHATEYFADNNQVSRDWGGLYDPFRYAIHLLRGVPAFDSSLGATVNHGAGGNQIRSNARGTLLLASRGFGRFNRRTLSNQTILANERIYWANLGLIALGHADAFSVEDGERYRSEAIGIDPWRGADLPGGGSTFPFGTNYYQVTPKGLTREWGYVGNSYGEMQYHAANFYRYTNNTISRDQAIKMIKARAPFRRPALELSGTKRYFTMETIGLLAWRGARESDGDYANSMVYGDRAEWALGMMCAAMTLDTNALGYAKQMLDQGQHFSQMTSSSSYYSGNRESLYAVEDYLIVKAALAQAATNGTVLPKLPMTEGEPDFVWADEVSGIVAIKHGDERLWIAAFWQAKTGTGVNGVGRFHYSNPNCDHYGVLETSPSFDYSGAYFTRPNLADKPEANLYTPPDNPTQAYLGEQLPVAASPIGASDDAPFRGRCSFYAFRYGKYLIGMIATADQTFELKSHSGFISATNLTTSRLLTAPVQVGPNSTVVLYLNDAVDPCPVPTAPLLLTAIASGGSIDLEWSASSGADTYTVKRATSSGGPYTLLATNLTTTSHADASAAGGVTYDYTVSGSNTGGEGDDSMEAVTSAELPAPWNNTDIGSVLVQGGASYVNGTFVVTGSGADIGSSFDEFQFAYQSMTGNGSWIARLARMQPGSGGNKVGLMMRESTSSGSRLAALLVDTGQHRVRPPIRTSTSGDMSWTGADGPRVSSLPLWLRLDRSGNTFTGYISSDGSNWTFAVSRSVTLNSTLQVGWQCVHATILR